MARKPWAGEEHISGVESQADNNGLRVQAASAGGGTWSVGDAVSEVRSNRRLAEKILAERGITDPTKTQINSQMRNIQRWLNNENGVEGKQAHKPSKDAQSVINKIGRRAAHSNESARVSINGQVTVNGYKRPRSMEIGLNPDAAERFFDAIDSGDMESAWGELAGAYGVRELHAIDASIDIEWES